MKVDHTVELLHHHGLQTSLVRYDDADRLPGNATLVEAWDVDMLLQNISWLDPYSFLVLGDCDFVLQVFDKVSGTKLNDGID